eukprot:4444632-Prymnesium_polylepis.1
MVEQALCCKLYGGLARFVSIGNIMRHRLGMAGRQCLAIEEEVADGRGRAEKKDSHNAVRDTDVAHFHDGGNHRPHGNRARTLHEDCIHVLAA